MYYLFYQFYVNISAHCCFHLIMSSGCCTGYNITVHLMAFLAGAFFFLFLSLNTCHSPLSLILLIVSFICILQTDNILMLHFSLNTLVPQLVSAMLSFFFTCLEEC